MRTAVFGIVIAIAGIGVAAETEPAEEMNVQGYSDSAVVVGVDSKKPVSDTNPADPEKSYRNTWFINEDGRLQFKEFHLDKNGGVEIHFIFNPKKKTYQCFPPASQVVAAYKDPVRKTIGQAVLRHVANPTKSTFAAVSGIDRIGVDEKVQETLEKRMQQMIDEIKSIDVDVTQGQFEPEAYKKLIEQMKAFQKMEGDIGGDPKKAALAREVMKLGLDFAEQLQDAKVKRLTLFINATEKMLSGEQKKMLLELNAAP